MINFTYTPIDDTREWVEANGTRIGILSTLAPTDKGHICKFWTPLYLIGPNKKSSWVADPNTFKEELQSFLSAFWLNDNGEFDRLLSRVNKLEEIEVLTEYEGPILSVMYDNANEYYYLCDWVDCNEEHNLWLLTLTSPESIKLLKEDKLSKRDAQLESEFCLIAYQGKCLKGWADKVEMYLPTDPFIDSLICAKDVYLNWCNGEDDKLIPD